MNEAEFIPIEEASTTATVFTCTLCGTRFTHGERRCGSCPLGAACDVVSCPRCGHGFPRSSRVTRWLARIFGSKEAGR